MYHWGVGGTITVYFMLGVSHLRASSSQLNVIRVRSRMQTSDSSFSTHDGLNKALELLASPHRDAVELPFTLPESGVGEMRALEMLLAAEAAILVARGAFSEASSLLEQGA